MARRKGISGEITVNWKGDSLHTALLSIQVILLVLTLLQFFHANTLRKLPQNKSHRNILWKLLGGCGFLAVADGFAVGLTVINNSDSPLGETMDPWVGFYLTDFVCYIMAINLIFATILRITYCRAMECGARKEGFWKAKSIVDGCLLAIMTALTVSAVSLGAWAQLAYYAEQPIIELREYHQAVVNINILDISRNVVYILVCMSVCGGIIKLYLQAKHAAKVDKVIKILLFGICPSLVISALDAIPQIIIDIIKPIQYDPGAFYLAQTIIIGFALFMIIGFSLRLYEEESPEKTDSENAIEINVEL